MTDLHVQEDGSRDAPVVVLLHGLAGSTRWWDAVVPALAERYRVIRIDLLGHGRSPKPDDAGYEVPDHARRVAAVLNDLGVDRAVGVGHSTGGLVLTSLAEQTPGLVGALVLIDTGPRQDAFRSNGTVGRLLTAPVVGPLLWRFRTDALIRKALTSAFSSPDFVVPQEVVAGVRGMRLRGSLATAEGAVAYLREREVPSRLAALGVPVLVVFGEEDRRWRASSAAEYGTVAGAQVELLPGVGHTPMLESPGRTLALVTPFLAAHAPRP